MPLSIEAVLAAMDYSPGGLLRSLRHLRWQAISRGALVTALFEPNLELLETFLEAMGDREFYWAGDLTHVRIQVDPPPGPKTGTLVNEMLASLQPILVPAFWGCVQYKGHVAKFVHACDACRNWALETTESAKTRCAMCGAKGPRRKVDLPWRGANRFGRPRYPQ